MSTPYPVWPLDDPTDQPRINDIRESITVQGSCLFTKEEPVELEVAVATPTGVNASFLDSEQAVEDFLSNSRHDGDAKSESPLPAESGDNSMPWRASEYFLLQPAYGWSELLITKRAALQLLAHLRVFPDFFPYLAAFGQKSFQKDEGFGGFTYKEHFTESGEPRGLETCYLLKYAQKRETAGPRSNPWSIRHALIYQNVDYSTKDAKHILVRISDTMSSYLRQGVMAKDNKPFATDWTQLHSMCIDTVDDGFRDYINYIDEEISKLFDRVIMSGVEPGQLREFDTPAQSSRDMKALQFLADQARRLAHVIDVNIDTLDAIMTLVASIKNTACQAAQDLTALDRFSVRLNRARGRHKSLHKSLSVLITRAQALSSQYRDAVALRNSEIRRLNMEETKLNTTATLSLSERSSHEARVLKTLTVVALVFAPASFVADFLQMGYLDVSETGFQVNAQSGLQLYALLALPLITFTMTIYGAMEFAKRRKVLGKPDTAPLEKVYGMP